MRPPPPPLPLPLLPWETLTCRNPPNRKLVKHVTVRSAEAAQRPRAIDAFKVILGSSDAFAASARYNLSTLAKDELPKYTEAELSALEKLSKDAREWFAGAVKKQEALKAWEDPVLKVAEMEKRARELDAEVSKLRKKKAPRKAKVASGKAAKATPVAASESTAEEKKPEATAEGRPKDEL